MLANLLDVIWCNTECCFQIKEKTARLTCLSGANYNLRQVVNQQIIDEFQLNAFTARELADKFVELLTQSMEIDFKELDIELFNRERELELIFDDECLLDFTSEKRGDDKCLQAEQVEVCFCYLQCYL